MKDSTYYDIVHLMSGEADGKSRIVDSTRLVDLTVGDLKKLLPSEDASKLAVFLIYLFFVWSCNASTKLDPDTSSQINQASACTAQLRTLQEQVGDLQKMLKQKGY